jgi:hypothetical protein
MRVIIDVTGLPWARHYYHMFPFEPSRNSGDDMRITKFEHLEHPTLLSVLGAMGKAASEGENEVMLVAHGDEKGLVMKISPHIPFSAEVSMIKWLPVAVEVFDLIDTSTNTAPNRGLLNAWAHAAALFEVQADQDAAEGVSSRIAQDLLSEANNDISRACTLARARMVQLVLHDPQGLVHMLKTTERALREVAAATRRMRDSPFSRIELRACNIGSGPGIAALRSFFACDRLMAPKVHTFYVQVNAFDNDQRHLDAAAKSPGWRVFLSDPQVFPLDPPRFRNPFIRPHFDPPLEEQAVIPGSVNFLLKVIRIETPRYTSEARRLNARIIQPWVARYIHPDALHTGSGVLWVGGLDTPTSRGEPFTLPRDSTYRSLIAVATASGVER